MKYYTSKHFCVQEYIPPEIYSEKGEKSILLMDDRILKTDDSIREFFNVPIIMNTWWNDKLIKQFKYRRNSGFRNFNCTEGSKYSQHKYGRASDKLLVGLNIKEVIKEIIKNRKLFPYIAVIEDNVSWLHTDCRCLDETNIRLINP
jgi:hypothetical protein